MNEMNFDRLKAYLEEKYYWDPASIKISPLNGGFSNLTFLIETPKGKFALRRPPFGYKISTAHDMVRESGIQEALHRAGYHKAPKSILLFEDDRILGAPFFIMEYIEGTVIRNRRPSGIIPQKAEFEKLWTNTLDALLELHRLELRESGLLLLGKPEGYVERQILGWTDRYQRAKTDEIKEMEKVAEWLKSNIPSKENYAFIHNDFKYDNLILEPENISEIKAVLDWEMSTVGEPLMDLGTSLAYWAQEDDEDILKIFNLTHLPGNPSREEVIAYYDRNSGLDLSNMLYYYVYGLFKVAVIAQQIYKRYKLGQAQDQRFAGLIEVVKAAGRKAEKSILTEKI